MTALAPFALVRVAAVPFAALTELRPPRLGRLCDELAAARTEQARLRSGLEDALHAAVPRAGDDVRVRRALIDLKRAVHNGRSCKVRPDDLVGARASLPSESAADLDAWLAGQATVDAAIAGAGAALADDTRDHVRPRLRALAADPALDRPLSLASPELWRSLRREAARPATIASSSKAERSLLGYLVRAAAKANPFSTFAWIGAVELHDREPAAPSVDGVPRWVRSVLNRATVDRLERAALAAPERPILLRRNPAFRLLDGDRVEVVVAVPSSRDGRPWRQPIRRVFRTPAAIGRALEQLPDTLTAPALVDALRAVAPSHGTALATRLLEAGVFAPIARADAFTDSPAPIVASSLLAESPAIAASLSEMATTADRVASAHPTERIALIERVRVLEESTLAAARATDRAALRNAVIEMAGFATRCGGIGAPLAQVIADVGTALRDLVRLDPSYLALRDDFVARFGIGGACVDALGFLHQHADCLVVPSAAPPSRELPASFPAPVTLAFQIAARDAAAAAAGDAQVVVNRIYPGIGWVTARHALGSMPAHAALRDDMKRWLREAAAPAEPIDVPLCGHASDLQAHPRLTERVLEWPSEPLCADTPGVVRVRDVRIVHDAATDRLALEDRAGRRLAPMALGSMLIQPAMGAYYLLWRIGTPHTVITPGVIPPANPDAIVEHRPRKTAGRVVIGREAWWVSSRWLRERVLARNGADRALAAAEELGALGVPPTFFARPYLSLASPLMFDSLRKPIWIDSRNPFFLDLLAPVLESSEWTVLTETLPGRGQVWTRLDGNDHVAEFHTEMILQ